MGLIPWKLTMKVTGNAQDQLLGVTGENNFVPTLWRPILSSFCFKLFFLHLCLPPPPQMQTPLLLRERGKMTAMQREGSKKISYTGVRLSSTGELKQESRCLIIFWEIFEISPWWVQNNPKMSAWLFSLDLLLKMHSPTEWLRRWPVFESLSSSLPWSSAGPYSKSSTAAIIWSK